MRRMLLSFVALCASVSTAFAQGREAVAVGFSLEVPLYRNRLSDDQVTTIAESVRAHLEEYAGFLDLKLAPASGRQLTVSLRCEPADPPDSKAEVATFYEVRLDDAMLPRWMFRERIGYSLDHSPAKLMNEIPETFAKRLQENADGFKGLLTTIPIAGANEVFFTKAGSFRLVFLPLLYEDLHADAKTSFDIEFEDNSDFLPVYWRSQLHGVPTTGRGAMTADRLDRAVERDLVPDLYKLPEGSDFPYKIICREETTPNEEGEVPYRSILQHPDLAELPGSEDAPSVTKRLPVYGVYVSDYSRRAPTIQGTRPSQIASP